MSKDAETYLDKLPTLMLAYVLVGSSPLAGVADPSKRKPWAPIPESTEDYHVQTDVDVPEVLGSLPGIHAYNQWSLNALSSAAVVKRFGSQVLEAFEAQKLFLEGQAVEEGLPQQPKGSLEE